MRGLIALCLALAPLCAQPDLTAPDLERGKRLFQGQCAPCHGITGTGGAGPNLATPRLKHASDDATLIAVIQNGIDNTDMPPAWQMSDHEAQQVAAYVRSIGRVPPISLPGDTARGRAIFSSLGCLSCHIVDGKGGNTGPDLSEVGARRSAVRLRECLLKPGAALPDRFMMIRAVDSGGSAIEGVRLNEDNFTVQLRDLSGRIHSLRKTSLRSFEYQPGHTPMPSYADRLSATATDDLVAYLASLRGRP